jgi:hypothetical protein
MMKKYALVIFLLGFLKISLAQVNNGVRFDKLVHNFGNVKEESNSVNTIFTFTNISNEPIYIVKVETSCGCTTPEYSKDKIEPGKTGFVKAIYETRGRGGDFHKNLFVHFNKENYYQSLIIAGYVIPEANLAQKPASYTTTYSNLAFNTTMAEFPNLLNTEKRTIQIKAYNYMGYAMRIHEITEQPDYITIDLGDSILGVNDSLIMNIEIDGSKVNLFGESRRRIALLTDDPNGGVKFLHTYVDLKEDFSKMSKKEKKEAPKLVIEPANPIELGSHTAGARVQQTIQIKNTGKTPLLIRGIIPNCSCVKFKFDQQTIQAGESVSLNLTLDTVNQSIAEHTKYITVLCNDPNNSEYKIKLKINITY